MMCKEKSGAGHKFKALALVPMLALALGVTEVPAVRAAVSTISSSGVSVSKNNENLPESNTRVQLFKVTRLNNFDDKTTVVVKGKNLGDNITVSGGTFTTMGKTYQAKSLRCDMTDRDATIIVTFPFTSEYEHTRMTLVINGEEIPFNLDGFMR